MFKKHEWPGETGSFTATPFRDCGDLAVHKLGVERASIPWRVCRETSENSYRFFVRSQFLHCPCIFEVEGRAKRIFHSLIILFLCIKLLNPLPLFKSVILFNNSIWAFILSCTMIKEHILYSFIPLIFVEICLTAHYMVMCFFCCFFFYFIFKLYITVLVLCVLKCYVCCSCWVHTWIESSF